jgi:hypothetical protein
MISPFAGPISRMPLHEELITQSAISVSSQYRPAIASSPVKNLHLVIETSRLGLSGQPRKWTPSQPPVMVTPATSTPEHPSSITA